ncbi:MAG TPA: glycosyltransferase family 87 protein, partial [Candidatus Polarisedimenticolaceae bacterium]|nr:glycosyltransferase family 87 protein [Candidatus Polarisedimenticolaceae bacterium]
AAVTVLIVELRPHRRVAAFVGLALLVTLNHEPFFETLWKQQAETAILLLLALSIVCIRRERDGVAGALLGLAIMLKIYPAALAAYFVVRRRFAALAWCAITLALVTVATTIVFGLRENAVYFLQILPGMVGEVPIATSENLSLGRYARTIFGIGPGAAEHVVRALAVVLLGVTALVVHRARGREREPLAFGAFVPLFLLVMPNSWVSYQLLLLVPLVAVLKFAAEHPERAAAPLALVAAAGVSLLFYWPCAAPEVPWPCARTPFVLGLFRLPRGLHDLLVDARIVATLLTWAAVLLALRDDRHSRVARVPPATPEKSMPSEMT